MECDLFIQEDMIMGNEKAICSVALTPPSSSNLITMTTTNDNTVSAPQKCLPGRRWVLHVR